MTLPDFTPYFKGTNFGSTDYDAIVLEGLMKLRCGYANGSTLDHILMHLEYADNYGVFKISSQGNKALYELYERLKKRVKTLEDLNETTMD